MKASHCSTVRNPKTVSIRSVSCPDKLNDLDGPKVGLLTIQFHPAPNMLVERRNSWVTLKEWRKAKEPAGILNGENGIH
jgi:hypothetical protein